MLSRRSPTFLLRPTTPEVTHPRLLRFRTDDPTSEVPPERMSGVEPAQRFYSLARQYALDFLRFRSRFSGPLSTMDFLPSCRGVKHHGSLIYSEDLGLFRFIHYRIAGAGAGCHPDRCLPRSTRMYGANSYSLAARWRPQRRDSNSAITALFRPNRNSKSRPSESNRRPSHYE